MLRIYVDIREKNSELPKLLLKNGIVITWEQLPVADYVISEKVAIERKTVRDLINSLKDGRLFDQAKRLKEAFERPFFLIEGDWRALKFSKAGHGVPSAIASLQYDFQIGVLYAPTVEDAARVIAFLTRREQEGNKRRVPVKVQGKPPLNKLEDWQRFLVQCLPGIGPALAERLLSRFGSVRAVYNASEVELARVEGISESKAKEIVKILTSPWRKTS
ncbi:multidrug MFS transporter [Ignicoccus islandicus DSM 13165]|uniref:Multidrug MFS transporter n=1 Tax=Ignicoccus islandicus DSM 13165 TaxID=940295 RepID=A0A0U3EBH7_9CREN|nr:ERCC4 domain-containing protein [Ignicoccus islandicus]ALU11811.1 multidrug MFS transporter [Ignicoccus islandicus DSM 13165]